MVTETGALEPEDTDQRGRVKPDAAALIRQLRVAEPWERYDSNVIGENAELIDSGWSNTWADLVAGDSITWFGNRNSSVGKSYTNQRDSRTDYAQDFYQFGMEFYAPPGFADLETDPNDAQVMPLLFVKQLAEQMALTVTIADTDPILLIPANRAPAGIGDANAYADGSAAPFMNPGTQGAPVMTNTWKFPVPIMLPAVARISVEARIDNPMRTFLSQFTASPGAKLVFNPATNAFERLANFYIMKAGFRGPRYLQFRGAREAS